MPFWILAHLYLLSICEGSLVQTSFSVWRFLFFKWNGKLPSEEEYSCRVLLLWRFYSVVVRQKQEDFFIHKLWWLQVKFGIRWSLLIFRIKNVQMVDLFLLLLICISWFCFFCCWFASSYMELFPVSCNCSHFFCAQSPCSFKICYEKSVYPYIFSSHLSLTRHVRGM